MHNYIFNIGDLVCCPRKQVETMWGTCIIIGTGSVETSLPGGKNFYYYNIYSPVRQQTVQMPVVVLENNWYVPGNEKVVKDGKDF